jgi:phage repressor protein C with HTH and peptisase S24 domain
MGHLFPMVDSPLQARLRSLLKERGMSARELSLKAGLNETAVKAILRGSSESPRGKTISAIASVLDIPPSQLLTQVNQDPGASLQKPNTRLVTNPPSLPDFQSLPRDVPVMGRALGGPEGTFALNLQEGPLDWARRPTGLAGVDNVFALYVEGDSMSPWREPGDLIYVSKARPAQIGSHVVVVLKSTQAGEPPMAYVKKLVRRTASRIELRQYNPDALMCLEMAHVHEVLRVVEFSEVLGI